MAIVIYRNRGLSDGDTGGQTSTVAEPTVANNGRRIFASGNWYAARSLDGGDTWRMVDPFSALPAVNGGFCCDQTLIYERSRNILIWLLQYSEFGGTNSLRIAINPDASLLDDDWHWWDFSPVAVNSGWHGEWFDYNHAATSDNFLYVGTNVFRASTNSFTRAVVLRLPLDALASAGSLDYTYFSTRDNFSLRCTQGADDVMYFASHNTRSQMRIFSWPESSPDVSVADVGVSQWNFLPPYTAPGPDGRNWLSRCDPRITGAAVADGVLTFAWTVSPSGQRPLPHVRVARIDAGSKQVLSEPDIWNDEFAYAYPALAPNRRGTVGLSMFYGGGAFHPSHLVGAWNEARSAWDLKATKLGSDGPDDGKWGDYLNIVPYSGHGYTWYASGFTLQGGKTREEIEPRVVRFGHRER